MAFAARLADSVLVLREGRIHDRIRREDISKGGTIRPEDLENLY